MTPSGSAPNAALPSPFSRSTSATPGASVVVVSGATVVDVVLVVEVVDVVLVLVVVGGSVVVVVVVGGVVVVVDVAATVDVVVAGEALSLLHETTATPSTRGSTRGSTWALIETS